MDLTSIIVALSEKGYHAVPHDVMENGRTKHGISIQETNVSPCICVEEFMQRNPSMKTEELVAAIINQYETQQTIKAQAVPMYLVTNENSLPESSLAISSTVKDWAHEMGVSRLVLFPTGTGKIILFPVDDIELDTEYLTEAVSETDNTQMKSEERLNPRAYLLHLGIA